MYYRYVHEYIYVLQDIDRTLNTLNYEHTGHKRHAVHEIQLQTGKALWDRRGQRPIVERTSMM